jgi:hypothetical protein
MLTNLLTGRVATPRDERIQDGTMVRRPPAWRPCRRLESTGEHTAWGNLDPGARPLEQPKSGLADTYSSLYRQNTCLAYEGVRV